MRQLCVHRDMKHLGSLESTQEAKVALGYASNNSYASFVLSKLPACFISRWTQADAWTNCSFSMTSHKVISYITNVCYPLMVCCRMARYCAKLYQHSPCVIARVRIPPVLVPAIQSNSRTIGCFVNSSKASSSCMRISPRMPPPSMVRTASFLWSDLKIDSVWEPTLLVPESTESCPELACHNPADTTPAASLMMSW